MPVLRMPDASFLQIQQLLLPPNGSGGKSNTMNHFLLPVSLVQLAFFFPPLQNEAVGTRRREKASSQGPCFGAWSTCGGSGSVG